MVKKQYFARPFEVLIDKREGWNAPQGTGAGIHGVRPETY
jgi:hypothetical protein